jgi:hypothetical protein
MNLDEARIKKAKEWFSLGGEDLNISNLSCFRCKKNIFIFYLIFLLSIQNIACCLIPVPRKIPKSIYLTGKVIDSDTLKPIENVKVFPEKNPLLYVYTDCKGKFKLSDERIVIRPLVPPFPIEYHKGRKIIIFEHPNYQRKSVEVISSVRGFWFFHYCGNIEVTLSKKNESAK